MPHTPLRTPPLPPEVLTAGQRAAGTPREETVITAGFLVEVALN